jgi:hypothetical protein
MDGVMYGRLPVLDVWASGMDAMDLPTCAARFGTLTLL